MPKRASRTTKTIALSAGKAVASTSGIALAAILVRLFTKEEWATYRQTILVFTICSPFLGMGLARSIMYFLPSSKQEDRASVVLAALGPVLVAGLCYFCFIVFGGNHLIASVWKNEDLIETLLITSPIALLSLATACVAPALIATERVSQAAIFGCVTSLAIAICTAIATWFFPEVAVALKAQVVASLCAFAVGGFLLYKYFGFKTATVSSSLAQLAYGIPLGLSTAVNVVSQNVDKAMVSGYCELKDFAIFDRGAIELPLVGIITGSMTAILLVDYRIMFAEGRLGEVLPLLHRAVEKSAFVLIPAMCFLLLLAPEAIVVLFGKEYLESVPVFRTYLLILPCRTLAFGSVALAAGKTVQLAMVPIVALGANLVLNYFAIQYSGYIGCAISTVLVIYLVSAMGRAFIAKNILGCSLIEFLPLKILFRRLLLSAVPLIPTVGVLMLIPGLDEYVRLFLCAVVYGLSLLCVLTAFDGFKPRKTFNSALARFS